MLHEQSKRGLNLSFMFWGQKGSFICSSLTQMNKNDIWRDLRVQQTRPGLQSAPALGIKLALAE